MGLVTCGDNGCCSSVIAGVLLNLKATEVVKITADEQLHIMFRFHSVEMDVQSGLSIRCKAIFEIL